MYDRMDQAAKNQYIDIMNGIKSLNYEMNRKEKAAEDCKKIKYKIIKRLRMIRKKPENSYLETAFNDREDTDYFSEEKIAVYTCIIGNYDVLQEPLFTPDNCDYYVITDQEVPVASKWKKINPYDFLNPKFDSSPVVINRFFKIMPHRVFGDYRYSLYVDGNFQIYTDMTEHINRISKYGMGFFLHSERNCVYKEINACKKMKKDEPSALDAHRRYLKKQGMPAYYGLLSCNIIARDHKNEACIAIMEDWWKEFQDHSRRDQISLPYVLYSHGILPEDVATLGGHFMEDYSLKRCWHRK